MFFYPDPMGLDYKGVYHCTMVMPIRSELHYEHAPPSHWATKILVPMYVVRGSKGGREFMCDVLGGKVTGDNAYIASYSEELGAEYEQSLSETPGWPKLVRKHPTKLERGEICIRRYSLSGSSGVYFVERVL